jgi:uncharacterized protein
MVPAAETHTLKNAALAALAGGVGAVIFWFLGAPLPFMLGALAASAAASISGLPWAMPRKARDVARPVIGVLAGSAFAPDFLDSAGAWIGVLGVVIIFSVLSTLAGYMFFRRLFAFDGPTAYFASTPAGLSEMSLMGDSMGGQIRTLFVVHSIRVVAVLYLVPIILQVTTGANLARPVPALSGSALPAGMTDYAVLILCGVAGYLIGKHTRLPSGAMVSSMVLSAVVHLTGVTDAAPPGWLVFIVQVIIGCVVGARFFGLTLAEMRSTALAGAAWALTLMTAVSLTALIAAQAFGLRFESLLLALAPGGMVEMTLLTYALGIEVAFVATCQVLRNFSTVLIAPAIYTRFLHRA